MLFVSSANSNCMIVADIGIDCLGKWAPPYPETHLSLPDFELPELSVSIPALSRSILDANSKSLCAVLGKASLSEWANFRVLDSSHSLL